MRYNNEKEVGDMPLMPAESIPYFENRIYLPMLITILERDRVAIEGGPFKLKTPYLTLIDGALTLLRAELKETNAYLRRNNMQVIRGKSDETFTNYTFIRGGYEDIRRYSNVRLRNRSDELLGEYFAMATGR